MSVLDGDDVAATAAWLLAVQRPDGLIPWHDGGKADPWNHVEAAMALTAAGEVAAATRAYRWLATHQRPDGSWPAAMVDGEVVDATLDTNLTAYVATGVWHHWWATGDHAFRDELWPVVAAAVGFVLDLQQPGGEVLWARRPDGEPWPYALLTGSSSVHRSLRCAVDLAAASGVARPDWEQAAARLGVAIAQRPGAFADKARWAMDWYYPVLAGVVGGADGRRRLDAGAPTFVMEGEGVRCVSDQPWVTAAETAECALAHLAVGREGRARQLLAWTRRHRHDDGSYWTGIVHPDEVHFPAGERTSYTAAAVLLANDALDPASATAALFRGTELDGEGDAGGDAEVA